MIERGTAAEVARFDQRHAEPAAGGFVSDGQTMNAAAHNAAAAITQASGSASRSRSSGRMLSGFYSIVVRRVTLGLRLHN